MTKKAGKKSKDNNAKSEPSIDTEQFQSLVRQLLDEQYNREGFDEDFDDEDDDDDEFNDPTYLALKARINAKVHEFLLQEGIPICDEDEDDDATDSDSPLDSLLQHFATDDSQDDQDDDLDDEDGEFTFDEFQNKILQLLQSKGGFQEFQEDLKKALIDSNLGDEDGDNSDMLDDFRANSEEFVRSFSHVQEMVEKYGNPYDKQKQKAREKELNVLRKKAKTGSYDLKMELVQELHDYMIFLANWVDDSGVRTRCNAISDELTTLLLSIKSISDELPPRQMLADHYLNLGILALDDEEYQLSVEYGEKALEEYKSLFEAGSMEAYLDIAGTRLNLSNAYDQLKNREKSIENAMEAANGFRYVLEQMQNDTGVYPAEENEIKIHLVKAMMVVVEPYYMDGADQNGKASRNKALEMLDEMIKLLTPLAQLSNQKAYRFLTGALRMRFVLLDS